MIDINPKIKETYKFIDVLGRGESSEVYRAKHRETGKYYALKKIIIKDEDTKKLIENEVEVWKKIEHPYFTSLVDCIHFENEIVLITEIAEGGELFDRICSKGHYSEADAKHTITQILSGVKYLHKLNIAHRDLKPENILYASKDENSDIKISDFGMSKLKDKDIDFIMTSRVGTPGYVAPEIIKNAGYTKAVDLWSVGVICYILLCGYQPFTGKNIFRVYRAISEAKYEFNSPYWDDISDLAKDFVSKLLVVDVSKRMTAKEALEHKWIKEEASRLDIRDSVVKQMKQTYKEKWKAAINASIAVARFRLSTVDHLGGDEDSDGDRSLFSGSSNNLKSKEKSILKYVLECLEKNDVEEAKEVLKRRLLDLELKTSNSRASSTGSVKALTLPKFSSNISNNSTWDSDTSGVQNMIIGEDTKF